MKMPYLRYLLDYQQLEEEWNPASMKKADLVAAVQDLKARGPLTSAQIFERFATAPEDQSGTEAWEGEEGEESEAGSGEAEPADGEESEDGAVGRPAEGGSG